MRQRRLRPPFRAAGFTPRGAFATAHHNPNRHARSKPCPKLSHPLPNPSAPLRALCDLCDLCVHLPLPALPSPVPSPRFTFLGTGTSSGIPVIACDCPTCTSDDPRDARLRTGAALEWTDPDGKPRALLIDATPDLRAQVLRHNLRRCDAILFTHNHVDHTFGLDEVRRFNAVMQAPIDIYADAHTLDSLRRVYRHVFEPEKNANASFVARLIPNQAHPARPFHLHGLRFTPIPLLHGRLPVLGWRIEQAPGTSPNPSGDDLFPLAYCTDVSGIPPEAWPLLDGVQTLALGALRFRHHPTHFTLNQALEAAGRIGARQTWFVHMSHEVRHAEVDPTLPEGVRLAYDGLILGPS